MPGDDDAASEIPLSAILADGASSAPPRANAAGLQRFDAGGDADDQTRLHVSGSFDRFEGGALGAAALARPSQLPARPRSSAPPPQQLPLPPPQRGPMSRPRSSHPPPP